MVIDVCYLLLQIELIFTQRNEAIHLWTKKFLGMDPVA